MHLKLVYAQSDPKFKGFDDELSYLISSGEKHGLIDSDFQPTIGSTIIYKDNYYEVMDLRFSLDTNICIIYLESRGSVPK